MQFGHYQLDSAQGLRRGSRELRLTPKALSVLCLLAERAGEVVSKEELFRVVWHDAAVSDSALTSCIQELRRALRDDSRRPRYIETLHRRGYRFVARISFAYRKESQAAALPPVREDRPVVGREAVLDQMLGAFAAAEGGGRQVLFLTGEPGIGKTTVVQSFLARIAARGGVRVTWGQCVQHYGIGEPYQPLLEAITRLCRQDGGDRLVPLFERYSPTWLAQLPALAAPARLAKLQRTAAGATRERMLRELTDALEAITAQEPLVLWLEDLHWTDMSTLDWVVSFAQRPERARLLLIGTFWPPSVIGARQPVSVAAERLRVQGFCRQIRLGGLEEAAVADYIALQFPAMRGQEESLRRLAGLVQRRTGGNPLFIVNVLGDLAARGLLVEQDRRWRLRSEVGAPDLGIPDDVRRTIERQIDRLEAGECALLEIASVAGATFSTAAVAEAAGRSSNEVEAALAALARQQRFVREAGVFEYPDGTAAARFEFLHVLYRDVLYERVPAGRRAELHRLAGTRAEAVYGERAPEIAAELAMHFERSRDLRRAGIYLQHAAENARRRSAYPEARMHYERALALLESEPPGRERNERETALRIGLGSAIMPTRGWGAPEVEEAFARARALCQGLGDTARLFPALWGLWLFYWGRGPLRAAHELAGDLMGLAGRREDPALLLQAHHACWATAFLQGDLEAVRRHASEGMRLYRADRDAAMAATYGSHDAGVCSRLFLGRALALLGSLDEAARIGGEAIELARDLGEPFSLALAHVFAAAAHQAGRDAKGARKHAQAAAAIAREQDFRLMLAWAAPVEGWAAVEQGQTREGLDRIAGGLAEARATGSNTFLPYFLGLRADALLKSGQAAAGLKAIDEAFGIGRRSGERFWEPELHRLRGELELAVHASATLQAERSFLQAIEAARSQGAKLLALRAAVSLGRLWQGGHRGAEARRLVEEARAGIEGANLPDMVTARALLGEPAE